MSEPLARGAALGDGLSVLEHLRRGEALDVYDAWDDTRYCRCIIKAVRPDMLHRERDVRRLCDEGQLLARLAHPHIVRAYELRPGPPPLLLLETLDGETLEHLIERRQRRLAAAELAILGLQLASALRYLHAHGVVHLDVKPSNVIVSGGIAKLLDLSLARPPGPDARGVGTHGYLAPEQREGGAFGPATDVWGWAATLYDTASGWDPDGLPRPPLRGLRRLPGALARTIEAGLARDAGDRPRLDEILETLEPLA